MAKSQNTNSAPSNEPTSAPATPATAAPAGAVGRLFDSANSVPVEAWQGSDPDTAKALYGVTDIEKIALKEIVGQEIMIIGSMKRQGDKGPYVIYLFIPRQEKLTLCSTATSSKSFIERVGRAKLPVRGTVEKEAGKKGDYYVLR
jgi:hypothetical protein